MTLNLLFVGCTRQITQYIAYVVCSGSRVRMSESHSPRTSPTQVCGLCDSLLCRTPFQKTIINYFLFTNRFRCTKMKKRHLVWCFFFYFVPKGNELPFAQRMGCSHTALRYLRREEQGSFGSTKWNELHKLTPSSISLKIFLHYDGFERPSRIVVARRLRKSLARVTPCLVGHRSKK